jgi:hypothetical protein
MLSLQARIAKLFDGFRDAHGWYDPTKVSKSSSKGGKMEIKSSARTIREPVTDQLWYDHISGSKPLGIIPIRGDSTCHWGCIDVDKYDVNLGELARVIQNLPLVLCRTKSGGAHIFMFLEKALPASDVQDKLRDLAASLGFGGSEIFPKQTQILVERGDIGNWLNMPYFRGDDTDRYCVKPGGAGMGLEEFLDFAEKQRLSPEAFEALEAPSKTGKTKLPLDEGLGEGPPCLQHLTTQGFPPGSRNGGLFVLGVFCKKKFGEDWQRVLETFNQKFMQPPLDSDEVQEIIKRLEKKEYNYTCKNEPIASHCNAAVCRTRKFGVGGGGEYPDISGMAVLDTEPPIWFLTVEGIRVELSTEELQDYRRFQRRCMEKLHICYKLMKQDTWVGQISSLMENVIKIETSEEVGTVGQFTELLEDFCTDNHKAEDKKDIILGRPWEDEESGRYLFRLRDLMAYFKRERYEEMSRGKVTTMIERLGGGKLFTIIDKKGVNLWWVPNTFAEKEQLHLPKSKRDPLT